MHQVPSLWGFGVWWQNGYGTNVFVEYTQEIVPDDEFNHKCRPLKMLRNIEETKFFLKKMLAQNPEETGSWSLEILKKPDPEELRFWRNRIPKNWDPEETGSRRIEILKKPDPEELRSWRKMRHTEDMSRWRSSWSVVFVKSFSFLRRRKTSYCWRGWRKRVPKVWEIAQLGILKKNPEEISCSRSSVLGCLRRCSSGLWGN